MKKKMNLFVFAAICCILAFFGCTKTPPTVNSGSDYAAETAEPTPNYRQAQAVTEFEAISFSTVPTLCDMGSGKIAAYYAEISSDNTSCGYLSVIDIVGHKEIAKVEVASETELLTRHLSNGRLILKSSGVVSKYSIYDCELNMLETVEIPGTDAVFSYDCDKAYYMEDGSLRSMDIESGETSAITTSPNIEISSIESIHPTKPLVCVYAYKSPFQSDACCSVVNVETGEFITLQEGYSQFAFTEDSEYAFYDTEDGTNRELVYKKNDASEYNCFGLSENESGCYEMNMIQNSPYALLECEDADGSIIYKLDDKIGTYNTAEHGIKGGVYYAQYMPEAETLVCYSYDTVMQSGRLWILDMQKVAFTEQYEPEKRALPTGVDEKIASDYISQLEFTQLPEAFQAATAKAEELEEAYGIRILMSEQCKPLLKGMGLVTATTEDMPDSDEAELIVTKLDELERALMLYPQGFFEQFADTREQSGLWILLSGEITSEYSAIGYMSAEGSRARYTIVLDITCGVKMVRTSCHEIWHATEERILADDNNAFSDEEWNAFNPTEFEYDYSYTEKENDPVKWTLYGLEDLYFVDDYSKTFPTEDRARIMEYVMVQGETSERLFESEYMKAKLDYMCERMRECFDTMGWDGVCWERYR